MLRLLVAVGLAGWAAAQNDVTAELKDQSQCSSRILAAKGVRGGGSVLLGDGTTEKLSRRQSFYRKNGAAAVVFPEEKLYIEAPPGQDRIRIPGCFILHAKDVEIHRGLKTLTAEFDLRIGALPRKDTKVKDWPKPLPCQQDNINNTCACGIRDTCFYCDFCKNFDNHITKLESNKTAEDTHHHPRDGGFRLKSHKLEVLNSDGSAVDTCNCDIQPGLYDIKAEVCTPTGEALGDILPQAVVALVEEGQRDADAQGPAAPSSTEFTLYTVMSLYDDRFNFINSENWQYMSQGMRNKELYNKRGQHLVGCHFIVTDVVV